MSQEGLIHPTWVLIWCHKWFWYTQHGGWELNLSSLAEQQELLTPEPSLPSCHKYFLASLYSPFGILLWNSLVCGDGSRKHIPFLSTHRKARGDVSSFSPWFVGERKTEDISETNGCCTGQAVWPTDRGHPSILPFRHWNLLNLVISTPYQFARFSFQFQVVHSLFCPD